MTSSMIGEYCDSTPPDIITTSNKILVHFYAGSYGTDTGFKLMYNPTSNCNRVQPNLLNFRLLLFSFFFNKKLFNLTIKNVSKMNL